MGKRRDAAVDRWGESSKWNGKAEESSKWNGKAEERSTWNGKAEVQDWSSWDDPDASRIPVVVRETRVTARRTPNGHLQSMTRWNPKIGHHTNGGGRLQGI